MTPSARARINLGAIKSNFELIVSLAPGAKVMAVVKGNAYGHGIVRCARALGAADSLAVARLHEARLLREAGISAAIVLLGGVVAREDLNDAAKLDVELCVHASEQIDWLRTWQGKPFAIWVKVDTGMHRLGFRTDELQDVLGQVTGLRAVREIAVMTHFANADDPADATTAAQIAQFEAAISGFEGPVSIANSGGLFGFSEALAAFTERHAGGQIWIRPGIALFGVAPLEGRTAAELGLKAAMRFESRLLSVKTVSKGDRVGYGGTWCAARDSVIGTIAAGYGDGYSRFVAAGTPVRVNGRNVPVVGRISMDLMAVDLGPAASEKLGDRVLLWGEELPVEVVAAAAGTAAYQLITGLTHREPPLYEA